jgi:hypothetical protein
VLKVSLVKHELEVSADPLYSDLLSTAQAAKLIGCPPNLLRIWAVDGLIPGARQAGKGKRWLFHPVLLKQWWANLPEPWEQLN